MKHTRWLIPSLTRLLPLLIIAAALGIRLVPIATGLFFFHFDSARDWLWVRDLVILQKPTLVGPWSSLEGVFYGPLTYYLLAIFFLIFSGHPVGGSIYALLTNLLSLILFFRFLDRAFGRRVALWGLLLLSFSAISLDISTFIFQTNPSLLLGVAILWPLWWLNQGKMHSLPWLFLLVGLGVQTNLFWTVFLLPFALFLVWQIQKGKKIPLKSLSLSVFCLVLPLLPQVLFELRHEFLQTKSLWGFITGANTSLGGTLTFLPRLVDRAQLFFSFFQQSVGTTDILTTLILLSLTVFGLRPTLLKLTAPKRRFVIRLWWLIGFFAVGAVLFPSQFKIWYLYPLVPMFIILLILTFDYFAKNRLAIWVIAVYLAYFAFNNIIGFLPQLDPTTFNNLKLFANQKEAVETVLKMGEEKPYAAYTYTEPIYDYPYQYLFWWYRQRTGLGPIAYGYLPDKYDYVSNKRLYDPQPQSYDTIILVMEKDNPSSDYRWETWQKAFYEYELIETVTLPTGVRVEKRIKS